MLTYSIPQGLTPGLTEKRSQTPKKWVLKVDLYVLPRSTAASHEGWHPVLQKNVLYLQKNDCKEELTVTWKSESREHWIFFRI